MRSVVVKGFLSFVCSCILLHSISVADEVDQRTQRATQSTMQGAAVTGPLDGCRAHFSFVYPYNSSWMDEEDVYQELYLTLQAARQGISEIDQQFRNHGYVIPGFDTERIRTFAYDSRLGLMQEVDLRGGPQSAVVGNSYSLSVGAFSPQLEASNGSTYSLLLVRSFPVNSSIHTAVLDVVKQEKLAAGETFYDNDLVIYVGGRINSNYSGKVGGTAYYNSGQALVDLRDDRNKSIVSQKELAQTIVHEAFHLFGLGHTNEEFHGLGEYLMSARGTGFQLTATQAAIVLARMCGSPRELRNIHGASPYIPKSVGYTLLFPSQCAERPAGAHATVIDPFVTGNASGQFAGVKAGLDFDTLPIGLGTGVPYEYASSPAGGPNELLCVAGERGLNYVTYGFNYQLIHNGRRIEKTSTFDKIVVPAPTNGLQFQTYELALVDPAVLAQSYERDDGEFPISHEQYLEPIWSSGVKLTFRADEGSEVSIVVRETSPEKGIVAPYIQVSLTLSSGEEYHLFRGYLPSSSSLPSNATPILVLQEELAKGRLSGNGYFGI